MSNGRLRRAELVEALLEEWRGAGACSVLFSQAVAARLGLNPTDLDCLGLLAEAGPAGEPVTAGRLAELTGLTTGAITGVLDRLAGAGYVRREQDPRDRRRVLVHRIPGQATATGRLFDAVQQSSAELCDRYSKDDLALILDFMKRSNALAQEQTAKLQREESPAARPNSKMARAAGMRG